MNQSQATTPNFSSSPNSTSTQIGQNNGKTAGRTVNPLDFSQILISNTATSVFSSKSDPIKGHTQPTFFVPSSSSFASKTAGASAKSNVDVKDTPQELAEYMRYNALKCLTSELNVIEKLLDSHPLGKNYILDVQDRIHRSEKSKELFNDKISENRIAFKGLKEQLSKELKLKADKLPLDTKRPSQEQIQEGIAILNKKLEDLKSHQNGEVKRNEVLLQSLINTLIAKLPNEMRESSKDRKAEQVEEEKLVSLAQTIKYEEAFFEAEVLDIDYQIHLLQFEIKCSSLKPHELTKKKEQIAKRIKVIESTVKKSIYPKKTQRRCVYAGILQELAANISKTEVLKSIPGGSGVVLKIGDKFVFKPKRGAPGMPGNDKNGSDIKEGSEPNRLGFPIGYGIDREEAVSMLGFGPHVTCAALSLYEGGIKEKGLLVEYIPHILDFEELSNLVRTIVNLIFIKKHSVEIERAIENEEELEKLIVAEIGRLAMEIESCGIKGSNDKITQLLSKSLELEKSREALKKLMEKQKANFVQITSINSTLSQLDSDQKALVELCLQELNVDSNSPIIPRVSLSNLAIWKMISKESSRSLLVESFRIPNLDMNAGNVLILKGEKEGEYRLVLIDRDQAFPDTWQVAQPFAWIGTPVGNVRMTEFAKEVEKMDANDDIEFLRKNGIVFGRESILPDPDDPSKLIKVGKDTLNIVKALQYVAKVGLKLDQQGDLIITANDVGSVICGSTKKGMGKSRLHQLFLRAKEETEQEPEMLWEKFQIIVEEELRNKATK